jgi:hypothetical protein
MPLSHGCFLNPPMNTIRCYFDFVVQVLSFMSPFMRPQYLSIVVNREPRQVFSDFSCVVHSHIIHDKKLDLICKLDIGSSALVFVNTLSVCLTNGQMGGLMDGWMDGWTDRQTDGWIDRWMDRRTDERTDEQWWSSLPFTH